MFGKERLMHLIHNMRTNHPRTGHRARRAGHRGGVPGARRAGGRPYADGGQSERVIAGPG
ncbi:MAG: hypothetical protein MZV70_46320 [Desulfobacterales bacterium]|nr:hypothetical protein [Desulfobacterales bacterium]